MNIVQFTGGIKHLEHPEDLVFDPQSPAFADSICVLTFILKHPQNYPTAIKWDGRLSIVLGKHPETGRFIMSSKSIFNKTPKFANSREQIQQTFNPAIVPIIEGLWDKLHRDWPLDGLHQADVLWTAENPTQPYQPNVVRYHCTEAQGHSRMMKCEYGIALHTAYVGKTLETLSTTEIPLDLPDWVENGVYIIPPKSATPKFTTNVSSVYEMALKDVVKQSLVLMDRPELSKNSNWLKQYVNFLIKTMGTEYLNYMDTTHYSKWLLARSVTLTAEESETIDIMFSLFKKITTLKQFLMNEGMAPSIRYTSLLPEIPGADYPGDHEGFVVTDARTKLKLKFVDRSCFSLANFAMHGETL